MNVTLSIPQFLKGQLQFTLRVAVHTRRMVSMAIHVERATKRTKKHTNLQADFNYLWLQISKKFGLSTAIKQISYPH